MNFKHLLLMLAAVTLAAASCKKEPEPEPTPQPEPEVLTISVNPSSLNFEPVAGEKTLKVSSNADWTVAVPETATWLTVTPTSGSKDGNVIVKVEENVGDGALAPVREAVISFAIEGKKVDVKVNQAAEEAKGTETNPYMIKTAADLDAIRTQLDSNVVVYFKLANDIDLSSIENWVPVQTQNARFPIDFDGQGYTIKNMNCKDAPTYASLFGLVTGNIRNVKFDNCSVEISNNSHAAIVAGWIGNNGHTIGDQYAENITATNCKVKSTGTGNSGGLFANAGWTTIKNCSFQGTIEANTGRAGGIIGQGYGSANTSIEKCSFDGTITSAGRYVAGIIAQSSPSGTDYIGNVKDCTVKGTLTTTVDLAGGIVAWTASGNYEGCTVNADITVVKNASNNYAYLGGIVGYNTSGQPAMTVKNCSYKGNLSTQGTCNAGIFGDASSPVTIEGCSVVGTITGTKGYAAGIIAYATKNGPATVKNCYSNLIINDASGQGYSSIIAADISTGTVIENCYAKGKLNAGYGLGAIAGRASNITNLGGNNNQDLGITVKGCISDADVKTVSVYKEIPGESPGQHYSIGAIVGYTAFQNVMADCFRKPDIEFFGYSSDYNATGADYSAYNTLFDQENSGPGKPLVEPYTDATKDKWFCPYHGKAYTGTASAKAKELGWDTSVWDLSGATPQLAKFPDK